MGPLTGIFERIKDVYVNRHEPQNALHFAVIGWFACLALALSLVLASLAFGGLLLMSELDSIYAQDTSLPRASAATQLSERQMRAVLDNFDVRRSNYERLKDTPSASGDPMK